MRQDIESPASNVLKRNWTWVFALGVISLVLGCIGLGMEVGLTLASMIFFSAILVVAGISHIIDTFRHKEWKGILWQALVGLFYLIAGGIVFYDPFVASSIITIFLAIALIVIGIARIMMAIELKEFKGWGWLIFAGLAAIVLGILVLMQWPMSGFWFIGMIIAIELIINGWTYIFIALTLKRAQ